MVRKALKVNSALELNGASVCTQTGTTTELNLADYFRANNMKYEVIAFATADETIKAYEAAAATSSPPTSRSSMPRSSSSPMPNDHVILPEIISKEPLGPVVRHGDDQWFDIVKWVNFAMLNAEELGVSSKTIDEALEIEPARDPAAPGPRRQLRRAARPDQGLGGPHHQARRQLRRGLRPQRRRRLEARHQPRPQPALDQGRHPVRAADPVVAPVTRRLLRRRPSRRRWRPCLTHRCGRGRSAAARPNPCRSAQSQAVRAAGGWARASP